jgi:hypothetical protein
MADDQEYAEDGVGKAVEGEATSARASRSLFQESTREVNRLILFYYM